MQRRYKKRNSYSWGRSLARLPSDPGPIDPRDGGVVRAKELARKREERKEK